MLYNHYEYQKQLLWIFFLTNPIYPVEGNEKLKITEIAQITITTTIYFYSIVRYISLSYVSLLSRLIADATGVENRTQVSSTLHTEATIAH